MHYDETALIHGNGTKHCVTVVLGLSSSHTTTPSSDTLKRDSIDFRMLTRLWTSETLSDALFWETREESLVSSGGDGIALTYAVGTHPI